MKLRERERERERARVRDVTEMVAFADSLRKHGYLGVSFSDSAVDHLLARAANYKNMLALADMAVQVFRAEK